MKNIYLTKKLKKKLIRIIISCFMFLIVFALDKVLDLSSFFSGILSWLFPFLIYFVIYLFIGYDIILKSIRKIKTGQFFDENLLMIIATFGAFGLAIYRGVNNLKIEGFDEACAVLIFYQIGEFFQSYAVNKSRKSISSLMNIRPDYANIKLENEIKTVSPMDVKVGDIVVVNPGERIPVDGTITEGSTVIDMTALTGESIPVDAYVGCEVMSGSINVLSQIEIKVTKEYGESSVSKILSLIESATEKKSKTENFISKFARIYTPIVCLLAGLIVVVPSIIFGNFGVWLYRALSFLVVSCPCALVISVPLAFFVGIGQASRQGILIKGSEFIEKLTKCNTFVFDKTGTLTEGKFEIVDIQPRENAEEILKLAATAEQYSNHPIAKSIVSKYNNKIETDFKITNLSGYGIIANNGKTEIVCGNEKLMKEKNINFIEDNSSYGKIIFVAKDGVYIGKIIIADKVKAEAGDVINHLNINNKKVVMLTGDNEIISKYISNELKINEYYSSLLPQDKVEKLEKIISSSDEEEKVCFVGDGINDAPTLMLADVGISMGGVGSDAAIEASDIVLMNDNLNNIIKAKSVAKKIMSIVYQNIVFSLLVKVLILILTAFGITNMWLAIFGDVGVAFIAILNSLRLNKNIQKCKNNINKN